MDNRFIHDTVDQIDELLGRVDELRRDLNAFSDAWREKRRDLLSHLVAPKILDPRQDAWQFR